MPRIKRGVSHLKKRRKLLAKVKGYKWGRKKLIRLAKTAVVKAGAHAYTDRKKKKRTNRALWQVKIGAQARAEALSYSKLMSGLKKNKIGLDRKILSDLAENHKDIFSELVKQAKTQ